MLTIQRKTLYLAYSELNDMFLREGENPPDRVIQWGMGHLPKLTTPLITLVGKQGWGEEFFDVTHPYHDQSRVRMLDKRYTDPELWTVAMKKFTEASHKKQLWRPGWRNFSFILYRNPARTRVPAGGGCLLGFTLTFKRNSLIVDVSSRSSELTKALFGDILYIELLVRRAFEEAEVKVPYTQKIITQVRWSISLGYQRSLYVPLFLVYHLGGPGGARQWMSAKGRSAWEDRCRKFAKKFMMDRAYPKVGSDRKWSNLYADKIEATGKWRGKRGTGVRTPGKF